MTPQQAIRELIDFPLMRTQPMSPEDQKDLAERSERTKTRAHVAGYAFTYAGYRRSGLQWEARA